MYCRISEDHLSGPGSLGDRLRALPVYTPPAGGWNALSARMAAKRRRFYAMSGGMALAASVVVAFVVGVLVPKTGAGPSVNFISDANAGEVAQLIDRSQELERELASARPQVMVWTSGREARASVLEQRLRVIDAQLNYAGGRESAALWRDRVKTMNALVDLHKPQSQAPALQYASYQY